MNRELLGVLILFGVAAFLYSRQSQASYSPTLAPAPSGESWSPVNALEDVATQIEQAVTEIFTPLESTPATPIATDTPLPFTNPIPPLPAM